VTRRACDGPGLLAAFRAAVENLERHVDEVNALNVFPVPDGDTGANMLATVRSALEEAEQANPATVERVAAGMAFGALMGARGNSGVITSQIFRGISEGLAGRRRFNALDMANALRLGSDRAYDAVVKPVEGTILTVARAASRDAVAAAEDSNDMDAVLASAAVGAERAVAATPTLLPILREAGVVDAGGQGLYRLLQGVSQALSARGAEDPAARAFPRASTLVAHADEGFGYETMFLVQPREGEALDAGAIRAGLEALGDSVLVAGDARAVKIHVHSERPDEVIAFGLTQGVLSRIVVENMDNQAREVRERRAAEFTRQDHGRAMLASDGAAAPGGVSDGAADGAADAARGGLAVIAVAAGEGLAAAFESFGTVVVRGGQSNNPSTGELLSAVEASGADDVLLLPNNPNVVLAARQVATMSRRRVHVVPTRNAAEGLAALIAHDPSAPVAANAEEMARAACEIQTLQVTEAVRDAIVSGRRVRRDETIVLDPDDGLVAAGRDRRQTILEAIGRLRRGYELITIYYGADAGLAEAEQLAQAIGGRNAAVEVEVLRGGQAHYRYLLSAE
jgi:DAK2 domain fusion protein YloV